MAGFLVLDKTPEMKNLVLPAFFCCYLMSAQSNVNELLAAGLADAQRFTTGYLAPVSEGILYSISGSWYNTADAKPPGGFEISIIANTSLFKNKGDKKSFQLNTADYENLQFVDGSTSRAVSTGLGDLEGIRVFVEDDNGILREEFELPTGLASEDINFLPSAFLQGSISLLKGTELKARFLPRIKTDDVAIGMYGFGIQHELTEHLPADKILPVAISVLIGYTHLDGSYDFTDTSIIAGEDQRLETKTNSWIFQAMVSSRLPVINFYGGIGYLTGASETDILGTYRVQSGPFQQTYTDPFSVSDNSSGVLANLGVKLTLGFFRIHADYGLGNFNTLSAGLNFGFR